MALKNDPGHPDEAVQPEHEVPSELVAEARLRHEAADSEWATPQEKKQAAVEMAHALSTRPDGSYAQLHETNEPTLAVADEDHVRRLTEQQDEAREALAGAAPVGSEARRQQDEEAARLRNAELGVTTEGQQTARATKAAEAKAAEARAAKDNK